MSLDLSAEASDRTVSRPGVARWLLAGILLLGALFRFPGYLYPLTLHYDEGAGVEAAMCRFPPGGTYAHPTLGRYLLTIAEAPKCVVTLLKGGGLRHIVAEWESDPAPFLRVARVVSLLSGLGTVLFAFLLGRALGGAPVGLTAALLLAVSPMHVHLSSTLKQWSLATLLTLAVLYLGHRIATTPASRKQLVIFGVVIGLATATVYPLFLLGLPVLVMLLGRWRTQRAAGGSADWKKRLGLVIAGAAVAHFLGNFSAIVDPQRLLFAYANQRFLRWRCRPRSNTAPTSSGISGPCSTRKAWGYSSRRQASPDCSSRRVVERRRGSQCCHSPWPGCLRCLRDSP